MGHSVEQWMLPDQAALDSIPGEHNYNCKYNISPYVIPVNHKDVYDYINPDSWLFGRQQDAG